MKKFLNLAIALVMAVTFTIHSTKALTKWEANDWQTEYYGFVTKKTNNITNLKGSENTLAESGMKKGPYSYASQAKLKDTITEEVYIGLNKDNYLNGDLFEVSLALKNKAGEYVSEEVVTTQKQGDHFVVTANGTKDFKAIIDKDGVYTYRWHIKQDEGKTYVTFTVLNNKDTIQSTGKIDMDTMQTNDTKTPIANEKDVSVKYLWFCNIKADYGVDVYTVLPQEEGKDITIAKNPNTYDEIILYVAIALLGSIALGYLIKKKVAR